MALGTIGTAIAASAASAGTSFGLSKLFGGGSSGSANKAVNSLGSMKPLHFTAGGLKSGGTRRIEIESDANRRALVGGLARTFPEQAAKLAELRAMVAPGFGRLTQSRVQAVENARRRGIGNLRENLARRRIRGSSFAGDALTRGELEFAQEEERVRAESFLQELQLTNELVNQEFTTRRGEFTTLLDELNLQTETALKLVAGAQAELGANARAQAQLAAQALAGAGSFADSIIGPIASNIGSAVGNFAATGNAGVPAFQTSTTFG